MLVLSRTTGQEIIVGDIRITVCRISGDKVRIGITAPEAVSISRPDAKQQEPQK